MNIIKTSNAPEPIGPYSQAVIANGLLFSSGQIAIDPSTNELITDSVETETRRVMKNIEAILKEADLDFSHIVSTTIFLKNMDSFAEVNTIYSTYFKSNFPSRSTVEVSRLPKNVNVEIAFIASVKS